MWASVYRLQISYSITDGENAAFELHVDEGIGSIRVLDPSKIDFETTKQYTLEVTATDHGKGENTGTCEVHLAVTDANDCTPKFTESTYSSEIPENLVRGATVFTAQATDDDSGDNAKITYSFELTMPKDAKNIFDIDEDVGTIRLTMDLDQRIVKVSEYTLTITATDGGTNKNSKSIIATVTVVDVNENAPQFEAEIYNADVIENINPGETIVSVKATEPDGDAGVNTKVRYSLPGDAGGKFKINERSGAIALADNMALDREAILQHYLVAKAEDSPEQGKSRSNQVPVVITVTDYNDQVPKFVYEQYTAEIPECVATDAWPDTYEDVNDAGCRLGGKGLTLGPAGLAATDTDDASTNNAKVRFSLEGAGGLFVVVPETGVIKVGPGINHTSLDFEGDVQANVDRQDNVIHFTAVVTDLGDPALTSKTRVSVTIMDRNDKAPVVDKAQTDSGRIREIQENLAAGVRMGTVVASDGDAEGPNSELRYSIAEGVSDPPEFVIDEVTGVITTNAELDFEGTRTYALTIKVTDQGESPGSLSGQVVINILVIDANDHPPAFETDDEVTVKIRENTTEGAEIATVAAQDKVDTADVNGETKYFLHPASPGVDHFEINTASGVITTAAEFDYETVQSYQLFVTATDSGTPELSAEDGVTIKVLIVDVNDHSPVLAPDSYSGTISEMAPAGTTVITATATDDDEADTIRSAVRYGILKDGSDSRFEIADPMTGVVTVVDGAKFDYENERDRRLKVIVFAEDGEDLKSENTAEVVIMVIDANDNDPEITSAKSSVVKIPESVASQTVVATVTGEDADTADAGGAVYFRLVGTYRKFAIGKESGIVITRAEFDYEDESDRSTTLVVEAYDSGPDGVGGTISRVSSRIEIVVNITDVNDCSPEFERTVYTGNVKENLGRKDGGNDDLDTDEPQYKVATVKARDQDGTAEHNTMAFSLDGENKDRFKLVTADNKVEATVFTIADEPFDRETFDELSVTIVAVDNGGKADRTELVVTVEDKNDMVPEFTDTPYEVSVSEAIGKGQAVGSVAAKDGDQPNTVNTLLRFSITGGNDDGKFDINVKTGDVTVARELDYEEDTSYKLKITVTDNPSGEERNTATATFSVEVTDNNDNPPVFEPKTYSKSLAENLQAGQVIATVQATDQDSGINKEITYAITAGDQDPNLFKIDATSGQIVSIAPLNFESREPAVYALTVTAYDKGDPTLTGEATVIVFVTDENDLHPAFDKLSFQKDIARSVDKGTVIASLEANDGDTSEANGGKFTYFAVSGFVSSKFSLNTATGVVTTAGSFCEMDAGDKMTLKVGVTDNGTPKLKAKTNAEIVVTVIDSNNHSPIFEESKYQKTLLESTAAGAEIATVSASDEDCGDESNLKYELVDVDSNPAFFEIDSKGTITLIAPVTVGDIVHKLDAEKTPRYVLTVGVTDQGKPSPRTATVRVQVDITDFNDNAPKLQYDKYEREVAESLKVGAELLQLVATDDDSGANADIRYTIVSGNDDEVFTLHETTGKLTTTKTLCASETAEYTLKVLAKDRGAKPLSDDAMVTVKVSEVNQYSPSFDRDEYTKELPENSRVGTTVVTVAATDDDCGERDTVTYSMTENPNGVFAIDKDTGEITLAKELNREDKIDYTAVVQASDNFAGGARLSTATVKLNVSDVVDEPPVFEPNAYVIELDEGPTSGRVVLTPTFTDKDEDDRHEFNLISGDIEYFDIDEETGTITTAKALCDAIAAEHKIEIQVTDSVGKTDTASVTVEVRNNNAHDPEIVTTQYVRQSIAENEPVDQKLAVVSAEDDDCGDAPNIRYAIVGGDSNPPKFELGAATGVLITKGQFDRETQGEIKLKIEAEDHGSPSRRSSVVTLTFAVTDKNDETPEFEVDGYEFNIDEGEQTGRKVGVVAATDNDATQPNNQIKYEFSNGNDAGFFKLDERTGAITTAKALCEANYPEFSLKVKVSDEGSQPKESFATVKVIVANVNAHSPAFDHELVLQKELEESDMDNSDLGAVVATIKATDEDCKDTEKIRYTIAAIDDKEGPGLFVIDDEDGTVTLAGQLDREERVSARKSP